MTVILCIDCGHARETTEEHPTLTTCEGCGSDKLTYGPGRDGEVDYEEVAQKLLELEATSRCEGWPDEEAIDLVQELNEAHGPFELEAHFGQKPAWWEHD